MKKLLVALVMLYAGAVSAQLPDVQALGGGPNFRINTEDYRVVDTPFANELASLVNETFDWSWAQDQIVFNPRNNPLHRSDYTSDSLTRNGQTGTTTITVTSVVTENDFTNYKWGTRTAPTSALYLNREELVRDAQIYVDAVAGREVFIWEISDRIYTASAGSTTFTFTSNIIAEDLTHFEGTRIYHDEQDTFTVGFLFDQNDPTSVITGFTQANWDANPREFRFTGHDDDPSIPVYRVTVRQQNGHLRDSESRTPFASPTFEFFTNLNYVANANCVGPDMFHRHLSDWRTRLNNFNNLGSLTIYSYSQSDGEYTYASRGGEVYTILIVNGIMSVTNVGSTMTNSSGCANEITEWLEERD